MSMDDLISRQSAIEAIEFGITYLKILNTETGEVTEPFAKLNDELREAVNRVKELPSAQPEKFEWCTDCKEYDQERHCCHRWTKVIRNTVAELKAEQRWISCSERLPEAGEVVLVYGKRGGIYTAVYNKPETDWRNGWWKLNSKSHKCMPDAWMPLPEPYEVEE